MDHHCAVACPVVTEAVQAATPESRIKMAIAAIKAEKISQRAAAERFGVSTMTLNRALKTHSFTVPDGTVKIDEAQHSSEPIAGKDGIRRHPPASPELISKAWELKDAGSSTADIARALERSYPTVNRWLSKPRSEGPPTPDPAPSLPPEPPSATPKPKRPKIPDALKSAHQKEQRWLNERWLPIAEHLKAAHDLIRAEKERLCKEYAGPQGSLIMQRRWQQLGEAWAEAGLLTMLSEATGNPAAVTMPELLAELERSSRMANRWITCLAIYTGCKQDLNRYTPTGEDL